MSNSLKVIKKMKIWIWKSKRLKKSQPEEEDQPDPRKVLSNQLSAKLLPRNQLLKEDALQEARNLKLFRVKTNKLKNRA